MFYAILSSSFAAVYVLPSGVVFDSLPPENFALLIKDVPNRNGERETVQKTTIHKHFQTELMNEEKPQQQLIVGNMTAFTKYKPYKLLLC